MYHDIYTFHYHLKVIKLAYEVYSSTKKISKVALQMVFVLVVCWFRYKTGVPKARIQLKVKHIHGTYSQVTMLWVSKMLLLTLF